MRGWRRSPPCSEVKRRTTIPPRARLSALPTSQQSRSMTLRAHARCARAITCRARERRDRAICGGAKKRGGEEHKIKQKKKRKYERKKTDRSLTSSRSMVRTTKSELPRYQKTRKKNPKPTRLNSNHIS